MLSVFSLEEVVAPLATGTCKLRGKDVAIRVLSSRESSFIRDELLGRPVPPTNEHGEQNLADPEFVKTWKEFTAQARILDLAAAVGSVTRNGWSFRLPAGANRHTDRKTWAELVDEGCKWRKETLEEWGERLSDADLMALQDAYDKLSRTDGVKAAMGNSSTPPATAGD